LYPDQCPGYVKIGPSSLLIQRFPGCDIGRLFACTRMPQREGNSMGELPLLIVVIRNRRGCCERLNCTPTGNRTRDSGPSSSTLSTKPSLHINGGWGWLQGFPAAILIPIASHLRGQYPRGQGLTILKL